MNTYEQNLINKINELRDARTPLQRSRRAALLQLLAQLQHELNN